MQAPMRREWQLSELERGTEKVPSVRMVEAKPVVLKKSFFQAGALLNQPPIHHPTSQSFFTSQT
jgi:hypothetical protein